MSDERVTVQPIPFDHQTTPRHYLYTENSNTLPGWNDTIQENGSTEIIFGLCVCVCFGPATIGSEKKHTHHTN